MMEKYTFRRLLLAVSILLVSARVYGQCNFTGLNANYCTNSAGSILVPTTGGGVFTGPGIVANNFNPSLAGAGTHTITYSICQPSYVLTPGTFAPLPTSGTTLALGSFSSGGIVNNDDGTTAALPIGFNFQYYCNTYTNFYLCTNGFITFTGNQASPWTTLPFPTLGTAPLNVIAFPWGDYNMNFGGTITYTTVGVAPSRKLVVSFIAVSHHNSGNGGNPVTLQLILNESTNVIEMHTTTMPINNANNNVPTNHLMGIQDAAGSSGGFSVISGRNSSSFAVNNECNIWTPGATCSLSKTVTVSPSTISVTGNNTICIGSTATLTAGGNSTYTWNTTANTSSITVSPSATQAYSVSATNGFGCVASSSITVTVDNTPTVGIASSNANAGACPGKTLSLTGTGASTYSWAGVPSVTNGIAFILSGTTSYTVTGINACGNSTAAITVSVHPLPTVFPVASSPSLCTGNSLTLTATGNATVYNWSGGAGPIVNGAGFVPPATATYVVIGTSALSCTASASVTVPVIVTPVIAPVASPSLVCIGGSSTLSAQGAFNYTWSSSSQTVFTPTFVVTPSSPGVSTYTITKANSTCSDTKVISVTTNSLPGLFTLASPALVCALQPATISVAGGQSYTWTAPGTPTYNFNGASVIVYPQTSSLFTVAASDGTCIAISTLSLTVDPNPTVSISASSPSVCMGQSVTLTASGGNSYTWTTTSGTLTGSSIQVSPTAATAYTLTGDNSYSCTAEASQIVLVFPSPNVNILVSKGVVCNGDPSTLTASGAGSYTWDANANNVISPVAVVNPTVMVTGPVVYSVTGSDAITGCPGSKTTQITVYIPTFAVTGNTNTCQGGIVTLSGSGASSYTWNTGSGTQLGQVLTATVTAPSVYTVNASATSSLVTCSSTQTIGVGVNANPTVIAAAQRTTICKGEFVEIHGAGAVSYTWQSAGSANGATLTVSPQNLTNNYTVTGTDANGCVGTGTTQVKVSLCTGFAEQGSTANFINIFPNPNSGEFIISADSEIGLTLRNDLGQTIRTFFIPKAVGYKISVNGLAEGIYFISGQNGSIRINQKIIVTK